MDAAFLVISGFLFAIIMLVIEVGYRFGKRGEENADPGLRAIDGFAFATLGFMLSFSLYSGNARLDQRRDNAIRQVSNLKTIIRRAELVPSEGKDPLQLAARQYAESVVRISSADFGGPLSRAQERETLARGNLKSVAYGLARKYPADPFVRSTLDAVDEVASLAALTRLDGGHRIPVLVYGLLIGLSCVCAFLAGRLFRIGRRQQMGHRVVFALLVTGIILATLDFDTPNRGLVTTSDIEKLMMEVSR